MNLTQYLLTKLAEECAEIAQRASKANLFGICEVQPGQPLDNAAQIMDELTGLQVIVESLRERGALPAASFDPTAFAAKRAKVLRYTGYSAQCGVLQMDAAETPAGFAPP